MGADEAVQRALEILIRRAPTLRPDTAAAWLRTVVKHEAFAVRAERIAVGEGDALMLDRMASQVDVEETLQRRERLGLADEALRRIKPGEAEALVMQADGHSYKEIARIKGWTYTKVNRLINEGSQAFRAGVAAIETGEACADALAAHDAGQPTEIQRRHVARCPGCRAQVRRSRITGRLSAVGLPVAAEIFGRFGRALRGSAGDVGAKLFPAYVRAHEAVEAVSAAKLAAIAASAAAIAGGSVAVLDQHGSKVQETPAHAARLNRQQPEPQRQNQSASAEADPGQTGKDPVAHRDQTPSTVSEQEAPMAEFDPTFIPAAPAGSAPPAHSPAARSSSKTPEFGP